jgi:hypothetical protein
MVEDNSMTFLLARYCALYLQKHVSCCQDKSAAHAITPCHPGLLFDQLVHRSTQACTFCEVTLGVPLQYCSGSYRVVQPSFHMHNMASNGWERPPSASSLSSITGTVLWAPLSVMEGEHHPESSMLEGLFISSLSISCNGKLTGRHAMRPSQLKMCASLRRAHLTRLELDELPDIAPH